MSDVISLCDGDCVKEGVEELKLWDRWVLWETKCSRNEYVSSLVQVGVIGSVEEFWRYYNNYPYPSMIFYNGEYKPTVKNPMRNVSSIALFREGVKPEWEDPLNLYGAELALRNFTSLDEIDTKWEILSCNLVGEQFDELGVVGIRVVDSSVIKRNSLYRIEVWFSDVSRRAEVEKEFRKILCLSDVAELFYREHSSAVDTGMYKKHNVNGNNKKRVYRRR